LEDFSVFATATYWLTDANINFYDTQAVVGLIGAMFTF